ncbi:MAG: penicillin-binding protein [Spirochaetales bacterium]|nr:penicillin-binding protein [Spirochaetales bacterium]
MQLLRNAISWLLEQKIRLFLLLFVVPVASGSIFVSFVYVTFLFQKGDIAADIEEYRNWLHGKGKTQDRPPIQILARDGKLIGEFFPERGSSLRLNKCKELTWLGRAAVSSEDRQFYEHGGISYRGIARAMLNNLLSLGFREGGGSITQQVARNLFTDRRANLFRKLYETFIAFLLEDQLSKDEILCLYLNKIYMGEGRIGAEEASWFYFRKPPEALDAAEAAMIVGLFPSPVRYSPLNNARLSLRKQEVVMQALLRDEHLNEKNKAAFQKSFRARYQIRSDDSAGNVGRYGASRDFRLNAAPAANAYVRQFLFENFAEDLIRSGGLVVHTTIDRPRQASALNAVRNGIDGIRAQLRKNTKAAPDRIEHVSEMMNGVLVSLDTQNGDMLALVGGYGVSEGNMTRRIFSMLRPPGSAIKAFLYAVALDEGVLNVSSVVEDRDLQIDGYSPRNWYRNFKGEMPIREAVALSVNTVAVSTLNQIGVDRFRNRMGRVLGLDSSQLKERFPGSLSLALGTGEMTPLEMARLHAPILNGGRVVEPRLITRVEDPDGVEIWKSEANLSGEYVLSPSACGGTLYLLESVLEEQGTAGWIGKQRNKNPKYLPFPVAGKSGTVQSTAAHYKKFPGFYGSRDAWWVGFVPGEVTVVWAGNDEGAPFPGSGAGTTGSIWANYAQGALPGQVTGRFPEVEIPEVERPWKDPVDELFSDYQDATGTLKPDAEIQDTLEDVKDVKESRQPEDNPFPSPEKKPAGPVAPPPMPAPEAMPAEQP